MTLARDTEIQFAFLTLLALMGDHGGVFCFVFFLKKTNHFYSREKSSRLLSHSGCYFRENPEDRNEVNCISALCKQWMDAQKGHALFKSTR